MCMLHCLLVCVSWEGGEGGGSACVPMLCVFMT